MSGKEKTPGQAAYEAHAAALVGIYVFETWENLQEFDRAAYEAAATAAAAELAGELNAARAELNRTREALTVDANRIAAEREQLAGHLRGLASAYDTQNRRHATQLAAAVRGLQLIASGATASGAEMAERALAEVNDRGQFTAQDYDNAAEILDLRDQLAALAKEILKNADPDEWDVDNAENAVGYVRRMEAAYDKLAASLKGGTE